MTPPTPTTPPARTPSPDPLHPGSRLRALLNARCIAAPGAFNALCATAVRDAGFRAAYVSGAATSVAAGVPDVGILTLDHFARVVREVCDATRPRRRPAAGSGGEAGAGGGLPVIADADTGFGESEMVRRTVVEYHRAGAAALHLEDQVFPKRCGHLDGKKLIPFDHSCEKIAAAVDASRACSNGAFLICARTDARSVEGLDAAIERARAYVAAGAEMIFPEGLTSEQEFADFADALRPRDPAGQRSGPFLLANMTEFGKTPIIPFSRFEALGYNLVIYPVTLLRLAMHAVARGLQTLNDTGSVESLLPHMQTRDQLYHAIGYTPGVEWPFPTS